LLLTAKDGRGNETTSGDLAVEVLSPEDYERRLAQRQGTLREELVLVRRNQQRIRAAIAEIRAAAAAKPYERGRDAQVDQGRVTNDLAQFLSGIHQVFDSYVLGRVGAEATIERLLP